MARKRLDGRELLRVRLEERGWSRAALMEKIGADGAMVSRWLAGKRTPSLEMACRMEIALGVPVEAWRKQSEG